MGIFCKPLPFLTVNTKNMNNKGPHGKRVLSLKNFLACTRFIQAVALLRKSEKQSDSMKMSLVTDITAAP